jgi:hypothetical protein
MKPKLMLAVVVSIGLAFLALSAPAQDREPQTPNAPVKALGARQSDREEPQNEETELAREANDLVRQLGEAKDDAGREKVRTKLSAVLEKQFDLRQKRHTSDIDALENQVKKLKELVQKRQENRRDIISKRLELLQRQAVGLGW